MLSDFEQTLETELRSGNYWGKDHNYYFVVTRQPHAIWTWIFGGVVGAAMMKPFLINKNERGLEMIPIKGGLKQQYNHEKAVHVPAGEIERIKVNKPVLSFGTYYWMKVRTSDGKTQNWQVYRQFRKDAVKLPENLESFIKWAEREKPWKKTA